MIVYIRYFIT